MTSTEDCNEDIQKMPSESPSVSESKVVVGFIEVEMVRSHAVVENAALMNLSTNSP